MRITGKKKTEKILTDFLTEKPITVRCRNHKYPQKEIYESLVDQGVEVKPAPYLPYAYEISNYNHILALDAFIQGKIQVQDVAPCWWQENCKIRKKGGL